MEKTMTSHERFQRMYEHREADRVPVLDSPWSQTIDRWVEEGMPTRDYVGYFDLDRVATITPTTRRATRSRSSRRRTTTSSSRPPGA